MLACIHKARRYCITFFNFFVGRLPNSSDMMMTLMFAANMTTTDSTTLQRHYNDYNGVLASVCLCLRVSVYKNVNIDSMFVVIDIGIDTSKCPTRQELCLCYGLRI